MNNKVSFICLITHPNIDPDSITNSLSLQPSLTQKAGTQVVTPKKTRVNDYYVLSKWQYKKALSIDADILGELASFLDHLHCSSDVLRGIAKEGGKTHIYLTGTDLPHISLEIDTDLLEKMLDMKIHFGFEFFSAS